MYQLGDFAIQVSMKLFAVNRKNLIERIRRSVPDLPKSAIIVLQGGKSMNRHCTDHEEIFRQESYFHWCFGVTEPDFHGAIEIDTGKSILFPPLLPKEYGIWMGKVQPEEFFQKKYSVDEVHFDNKIVDVLAGKNSSKILVLYGLNTDSGNYTTTTACFEGIEKFSVDKELLHKHICECRVFKSEEEIAVMRYANKISSGAHKEIMKNIKPGAYEFQMESIFGDYCYRNG